MLVQLEENIFVNMENIAYLRLGESNFEYTLGCNTSMKGSGYRTISKEELANLLSSNIHFVELLDTDLVFLNVKYITSVEVNRYGNGDDGFYRILLVNDDNPFTPSMNKDNKDLIKTINSKLSAINSKYVLDFSEG